MTTNKLKRSIFFGVLGFLISGGTFCQVLAQNSNPGILREIDTQNAKVFTIESTLPIVVTENCKADVLTCPSIVASIYSAEKVGNITINKTLVEELPSQSNRRPMVNLRVTDLCGKEGYPAVPGTLCRKTSDESQFVVVYRFVAPPKLESDKYSMTITIDPGPAGQVEGYSVSAKLEFPLGDPQVTIGRDLDISENQNLSFMYGKAGEEEIELHGNVIQIEIPLPDKPALTDDARVAKIRASLAKIRSILAWLDDQKNDPSGMATMRVDLRNNTPVKTYEIAGFIYKQQDKDPSAIAPQQRCLDGGDLPSEISPLTARVREIYCDGAVTIYLLGKGGLPTKPFVLKATLNRNAPVELDLVKNKIVNSVGVKAMATPNASAVGSNKALDLRSFASNLDLGLAFTSSVDNVKSGNKTIRARQNNGVIDLMFAPILDKYLTPPTRTQWLTTPFFIDAKASTGSITDKTLSLNRTLIGSEISLLVLGKKLPGDETHPASQDKFKFSFRFINASDRDFKRIEAKFNFETLFRLAALNRPLSQRSVVVPKSVLDPKGAPTTTAVGNFGYQIQPLIGFDLGDTYRARRLSFASEEASKFVRRFYAGLNLQFDITRHVMVTAQDTFYVRGEVTQQRHRNYFLGQVSTPIGNFGANAAQSIFFSFERGDQPPFLSPSVNGIKFGYRITSDFGPNGTIH